MHSLLAKGRLLYTHDETIADLCAPAAGASASATRQLQLLGAATGALGPLDKAHKWFITRGDLEYSALWILYAATPLAQIEVLGAGQLLDREVIPQALTLNPAFFKTIYIDLLNNEEDGEGGASRARRHRRLSAARRRRRSSRPCSNTCARWARRARRPSSTRTSRARSTSPASPSPASISPTSG